MSVRAPTLRPYQHEAINAARACLARLSRRPHAEGGPARAVLLELATGLGKTVTFAALARMVAANGGRTLVLAHRGELLDQAQRKLAAEGLDAQIEQADRRALRSAQVVVASVQSLRGPRLVAWPHDHFALVVIDEAHHATADGYRAIIAHFPGARILGVTATADRADGVSLGAVFADVAFRYGMRKAIEDQWLTPIVAERVLLDGLDLTDVRVLSTGADLDAEQLGAQLRRGTVVAAAARAIVERSAGRRTIAFGVDVAHARLLADAINMLEPGAALAVDGGMDVDARAAALGRFRGGDIRVLTNCQLYTEGFDEPSIGCVAVVRPTMSRALYTQILGRGVRMLGLSMLESIANGKPNCIVLDLVGNSGRHRLVGPVDALAGRVLDDAERAAVVKAMTPRRDLREALRDVEAQGDAVRATLAARAREKAEKAEALRLAKYRAEVIDLLGDRDALFDRVGTDAELATADQIAAIDRAKLGAPPASLTRAQADLMLAAVEERRHAGLCSVPQARLLSRTLAKIRPAVDTWALTAVEAKRIIGRIANAKAWGRAWLVVHDDPALVAQRTRAAVERAVERGDVVVRRAGGAT